MERRTEQERNANRIAADSVAIIATGDELLCGQIVNTNAPQISALLSESNYLVDTHLTVADDLPTIIKTLKEQIALHKVVITTGGLGPTRDDITRNAIAAAVEVDLVLDESNWEHIQTLITNAGYNVGSANKQQAYFPAGSTIITNNNGSASGCITPTENGCVIMLPGPPHECMPMLKQVLPQLDNWIQPRKTNFKNWLLHNTSESNVADKINTLNYEEQGVQIGYRAAYPYLEIKCWHTDPELHQRACKDIEKVIAEHLLPYTEPASKIIFSLLREQKISLYIDDSATGGRLESILRKPSTNAAISFHTNSSKAQHAFSISGLTEYWQGSDAVYVSMQITNLNSNTTHIIKIRNRTNITAEFAAEKFCIYVLESLKN